MAALDAEKRRHLPSIRPSARQALDGFQTANGFKQCCLQQAGIGLRVEHSRAHPPLQYPADAQHDRHRDKGNDGEPAAEHGNQRNEYEQEENIGNQNHRRRGKKVADLFIFGDAARQCPRAAALRCEWQVEHLVEQALRQPRVDAAPDLVNQPGARQPEAVFDRYRKKRPQCEHPQACRRLVRNDAVIDVHREQRQRKGHQIDEQRGQHHIDILVTLFPNLAPEPVRLCCKVPRPFARGFLCGIVADDYPLTRIERGQRVPVDLDIGAGTRKS